MAYSYDRRVAKEVKYVFEFPTSNAARDFSEEILEPNMVTHRVVEVQHGNLSELKAIAKKHRGYLSL